MRSLHVVLAVCELSLDKPTNMNHKINFILRDERVNVQSSDNLMLLLNALCL